MRQRARLPRRVERPHLGPRRQEPVDVVEVDGPRARSLARRHAADLPVPPHRMAGAVEMRRRPARPLAREGRRERHDPPGEPARRRPSRVRRAHRDPVRAEAEPAGRDDPARPHVLPGAAVDAVAKPRTAVGGVEVRRRDGEPLARRAGAPRRQAVHERRHRRPAAPVPGDRPCGGRAPGGAHDPERERRRVGLDDLGRRLDELEPAAGVGMRDDVAPGRERRRPRAGGERAPPAGGRTGAPDVRDLEAQQPVAGGQPPRTPAQPLGAQRPPVSQCPANAERPVGDRRLNAGGERRPCGGKRADGHDSRDDETASARHDPLRMPAGRASPCASIMASTSSEIASGESVAEALGSSSTAWRT